MHLPIKTLYMKDSAMRCLIALALIPMFAVGCGKSSSSGGRPDDRATPASTTPAEAGKSAEKSPSSAKSDVEEGSPFKVIGEKEAVRVRGSPREWYHGVRQRKQTEAGVATIVQCPKCSSREVSPRPALIKPTKTHFRLPRKALDD